MRRRGLGVLALGLLVAGCAAPPSTVGVYPDHVGEIDPALLVGTWACKDLDPPSSQERLVELKADHGLIRGLLPKGSLEASKARDKIDGEWQIIGGYVQTTDLHPVEGSDEGLGSRLAQLAGGEPPLQVAPRTLNVLDLDHQRLVFRNVNHDWSPVVGCRRLPAGDPA